MFMYFVKIFFELVFIYGFEVGFTLAFAMFFTKRRVEIYDFVSTLIPLAVISQFIMWVGEDALMHRLFCFIIIWIWVGVKGKFTSSEFVDFGRAIMVAVGVMMLVEVISFIPYLFIFGVADLEVLTQNIFITILLSIPTRVFEYIILYIMFLRKVGEKNEEENCRID